MRLAIGMLPTKVEADIILHPIKYKNSITYEPLGEEAVVALIVKELTYNVVDDKVREFFDEMDDGYLYSESNFDEFDIETIKNSLDEKNSLIIGKDIYFHPKRDIILKLINLLKLVNFEIKDSISDTDFEEIDELDSFDGVVVYLDDEEHNDILISPQFKVAHKINSDTIKIDGKKKNVILDENLKGVFAIVGEKSDEYPFKRVKIQ